MDNAPATHEQTIFDLSQFLVETKSVKSPEPKEAPEVEDEVVEEEVQPEEDVEDVEVDEDYDDEDSEEVEDEEEDSEDEEEVEEEAPEEIDFDEQEFEVTVNGEPMVVKGSELKSGYMRQADYTKKTTELAEQRKQVEQEFSTARKQSELFQDVAKSQLDEMNAIVQSRGGWEAVKRSSDPVGFASFKSMYMEAQAKVELSDKYAKEFEERKQGEYEANMRKVVDHLVKTVPNMSKATFDEIDEYVTNVGYDAETIRQIQDPISWSLLYKAMKYDKAQARVKEQPEDKVKPKRIHKPVSARQNSASDVSKRRLDRKINKQKNSIGDKRANEAATQDALMALFGS